MKRLLSMVLLALLLALPTQALAASEGDWVASQNGNFMLRILTPANYAKVDYEADVKLRFEVSKVNPKRTMSFFITNRGLTTYRDVQAGNMKYLAGLTIYGQGNIFETTISMRGLSAGQYMLWVSYRDDAVYKDYAYTGINFVIREAGYVEPDPLPSPSVRPSIKPIATATVSDSGRDATEGWNKVSTQWYYVKNGDTVRNQWLKDKGKWYLFDSTGKMLRGWQKKGSQWYSLKSSGVMRTGWFKDKGGWYYLEPSGTMAVSEWHKIGSTWYYFLGSGKMATGSWRINGRNATFASSGKWLGYY